MRTTDTRLHSHGVGTLNEAPLHAALKQWYAGPQDHLEMMVDGYIIDIVQPDCLVEIQTGHFSPLKHKLTKLLEEHRVRLVHPIAQEKWISKLDDDGQRLDRRKSPKRGSVCDLFVPLVSIPHLLQHPRFELEVVLVQIEEYRHHDPRRAWRRRGWVIDERRLLEVVSCHPFCVPGDLAALLPADLPTAFTTADMAQAMGCTRSVAQKMAYCLRTLDVIAQVGKQGNALLYQRSSERG